MAGEVTLIAKIAPKNDAFTGLVDAKHVIGGASNTLPDAALSASNITQFADSLYSAINHTHTLDYLSNVDVGSGLSNGQILAYNSSTQIWYNANPDDIIAPLTFSLPLLNTAGNVSLNINTTYFDVDSNGNLDFIYNFDTDYLRLDGSNNLVGADSWLTQAAGDARYLMADSGTILDVTSTINVTTSGLTWAQLDSYTIIKVKGASGAVVVTATPSIEQSPNDGQEIIILGMDDINTVTFQDGSNLAGSGLCLSNGQNMTLGKGDTLHLIYEANLDNWLEVTRSNNVYTNPITSYLLDEDGEIIQFEDDENFEEE